MTVDRTQEPLQKGRKPRKQWHKAGSAGRQHRATRRWPEPSPEVAYDGAPTPLPHGHGRRRPIWT